MNDYPNPWAILFFTLVAVVAILCTKLVFAQSGHLDDPVNYESLELRLEGCKSNLPIYFHKCMTKGDAKYSESQIGKAIKACNVHAWNRFFDCVQLYPPQTLEQQIRKEIDAGDLPN
jgi:hypothetical protein